jgi:hypothetical protein
MADRKITDLTALAAGSQATGDLLTIVDVSEGAAADKNKKITVESLFKGIPSNVGIGTSSPTNASLVIEKVGFQVSCETGTSGDGQLRIGHFSDGAFIGTYGDDGGAADFIRFGTHSGDERMRIDSSGNVGIGTSSPSTKFVVSNSGAEGLELSHSSGTSEISSYNRSTSARAPVDLIGQTFKVLTGNPSLSTGLFQNSSGNVGIGASLPAAKLDVAGNQLFSAANPQIQFNAGGPIIRLPSANTLAFLTDSTNERMRITSSGDVLISKTTTSFGTDGIVLADAGYVAATRTSAAPLFVIRNGTDGTLVNFEAQNVSEGSISVSGTTVSYNGAHLSRWSQLLAGAERTEILRGSVLSNLDEMCEWGEEDNEQLNRMKISDVEGDRNVAGVFQAWDDDDDTYTNDFYCAMTGDFVIRIAQGTNVARGDLLMSAGDGTAKPQDDDIVRSKTIAKVTSTTVSTTYADGSYCVPCVLMAC